MNPRRISVTELAQALGRSGDLGRRHFSLLRGREGIQVHQRMQKDRGDYYQAEVSIKHTWSLEENSLEIFGRIDGLENSETGLVLEEFKTSRDFEDKLPLDHSVHVLQAELYAWMWFKNHKVMPKIRLEYVHPDPDLSTRRIEWKPDAQEIEDRIEKLLVKWLALRLEQENWVQDRNRRLQKLSFPFADLRPGQSELMEETLVTLAEGSRLYVQAPTGIGKTMGILLPALQAMGDSKFETLMLATCRNTGKRVFEEAIETLFPDPPGLRVLTLVARGRICNQVGSPCDCEECPLAKGFYDRLSEGMADLRTCSTWTAETWQRIAQKHQLCPFAFMMHAAREADVILGDLNYALDPSARLEFLFGKKPESLCLVIDEAHHLPDRSRAMISADLELRFMQSKLRELPEALRNVLKPVFHLLFSELRLVQKADMEADGMPKPNAGPPEALARRCIRALEALEASYTDEIGFEGDPRLDLYRTLASFRQSMDHRQASHVCTQDEGIFRHLCLDPAEWLRDQFEPLSSVVLFSGTLLPLETFMKQTGSGEGDRKIELPSPYDTKRFRIELEDDLPLVWKARGPELYERLTRRIVTELTTRGVKTLIYFPSYSMMEEIASRMPKDDMWLGPIRVQPRGLQEEAADEFLRPFREQAGPMTGLAVLGGALNEGIDLPGSCLESVIVLSIGLPGLNRERELMRRWYESQGEEGFMLAYTLPGLVRVLQALGRVIRGPEDQGTALLIDPRFKHSFYEKFIPFS